MQHDAGLAAGGRRPAEMDREARLAVAGELVGAITHDLRQPLTALEMNISAAIHFLRQSPPSVTQAIDALGDALLQRRRMGDALEVLEDLANNREPYWHAFDVVPVVREVLALVRSDALARHVATELTIQGTVPPIIGDVTLVRHALLNVVLDALATARSGKHPNAAVSVTVGQVNDCAEVTVRHFGLRPGSTGGDGSGLAVARSVVDAHGASIAIEGSAEGGVDVVTRWPSRLPIHSQP